MLGKERGYLTYAEINDHLPDDMLDAEQIENIISMINDMGIQVYDEAPDAETLLMSEATPPVADEDVVEEAEAALSTVDSEFGRTTDPVRMYMREMGSVELLTREGEIEIAKRIEDGLRHMIQAISACPTTIAEILALADRIEKDEMRIDEVVDGLVDPNARGRADRRGSRRGRRGDRGGARGRGRRGRGRQRPRRPPTMLQAEGRRAEALRRDPRALRQDDDGAREERPAQPRLPAGARRRSPTS